MSATTLDDGATPIIGMREIGDTGVVVHPVGLDGSVFGWAAGVGDTANVLDRFRAAGGNLVSTADHYAGGRSEIMIGSWLRTVGDRGSVVVATKIGRHPDTPGLSRRSILRAVEASLDRLDTDYVDFLSFDGDHPETPLDERLEAVDRLIREGKVRFLSSYGYPAERIDEVERLATESGYPRFRAIIAEYSLVEREHYETQLQALAAESGRRAFAHSPLGNGYLTGQFRTRDDTPTSIMFDGALQHAGRRGTRILETLDEVATGLGQTPARIALAWVLVKPGIAAALLRAKSAEQVEEAMGATSVRLTRHHLGQLERASAH
ncbi:MAG TPA: aldo/keto reductase [Galbitalea sp.]